MLILSSMVVRNMGGNQTIAQSENVPPKYMATHMGMSGVIAHLCGSTVKRVHQVAQYIDVGCLLFSIEVLKSQDELLVFRSFHPIPKRLFVVCNFPIH